jgi:hypothetical protein
MHHVAPFSESWPVEAGAEPPGTGAGIALRTKTRQRNPCYGRITGFSRAELLACLAAGEQARRGTR